MSFYTNTNSKSIMLRLTKLPNKTILLLFFFFSLNFQAIANSPNSNPWSATDESRFATKGMERTIIPKKYKTFKLDLPALQSLLETAPLRFSAEAATNQVVLTLPMPNGTTERFQIFDAPIMQEEIAAQYPMIHSYAGVGIDDPTASLRFDVTQFGFHALVLSARHSSVYIDPYSKADTEHYISYYKSDFEKPNNNFSCHVGGESVDDDFDDLENENVNSLLQGDCQLRTYRIAISCSGEYANFHGGTVDDVMAAMNTTLTRVNGIYERDLNVNLVLVNNNDQLIFLNSGSDPYTNNSAGAAINEGHDEITSTIGSANFDVGHLFTTGAGGLAGLGVICRNNSKGRGVTGTNSPVGDPFDVDYVAHEIGHQFGANHTFNNSCSGNRNGGTAMEPGSGSTIMAYAGICNPNVQFNSDDYFHAISIEEISDYINNGQGNNCPTFTDTGNNPPTIDGGANYTLPISTPFKLTAVGTDMDNDVMTYSWEQMDNEIGSMPPASTNTGGPMFRSYDPTEDAFRYFPKINDIVNGIDDEWEELPSVSRGMSFRVTVRDNHMGGSCTEEDNVNLTFDDSAGPFLVQAPNTNVTWLAGTPETVTWDVANTDAAPVSCANVDILLSLDGGFTYPTTLASSVPNIGSYEITVPNSESTNCRVMVVCSDNIFFDISNNDFTIDVSSFPTFIMGVDPQVQDVCGSVGNVDYAFDFIGLAGFDETVTLTATGVPAGAMVNFSQNDFVPSEVSTLAVSNLANVADGTYTILVTATSTSISNEQEITLVVNNSSPAAVTPMSPANGATAQSGVSMLSWNPSVGAASYMIEIATTPGFGNTIIESATVNNNNYTTQNLEPLTVYYWRVGASNNCGITNAIDFFAFQTEGMGCNTYNSTDTPIDIPTNVVSTTTSTIAVTNTINIIDVNIGIDVSHTWIGDLGAVLTSPNNTSVELFAEPGVPASQYGCNEDNILLTFDDEASGTATELENTCIEGGNYGAEGSFQPLGSLADFNGEDGNGDWTLSLSDAFDEDGGVFESWNLELCFSVMAGAVPSLDNTLFTVPPSAPQSILNNNLEATSTTTGATDITFVVLSLTQNGTLDINGTSATIGATFTQADINNGIVTYTAFNGTTQDEFNFDVVTSDGGWIADQTFNIVVSTAAVFASAVIEQNVSCNGGSDGILVVNASGTNPPFQYSLNGGMYQSSEIFNNLPMGNYTVEVQDDMGNIVSANMVTITEPMPLTISSMVFENTITVTSSGGTGNLMYSIDGSDFQANNVFSNLPNGQYTFEVMDANGCITTTSASVNVIQSANVATVAVTCFDGNDGMLSINGVSGGTAPYLYSIDNINFVSTTSFSELAVGAYNVYVMDVTGYVFEAGSFDVSNAPQLSITTSVVDNSITANGMGGTGTYTYSINDGAFQDSNEFPDLPNGNYVITVQDENGCTTESISLTINFTSTNELDFEINFDLFPNPTHGQLTIILNQETEKDLTLRIFDVAGKLAQEIRLEKNGMQLQKQISVSELPAGSYEILLTDGNMFGRKRFVKM